MNLLKEKWTITSNRNNFNNKFDKSGQRFIKKNKDNKKPGFFISILITTYWLPTGQAVPSVGAGIYQSGNILVNIQ